MKNNKFLYLISVILLANTLVSLALKSVVADDTVKLRWPRRSLKFQTVLKKTSLWRLMVELH